MMSMTVGNIIDMIRPAAMATSMFSRLALAEPLGLVLLLDEGADDAHTLDLLAHDVVEVVDALLQEPEQRPHLPDDRTRSR